MMGEVLNGGATVESVNEYTSLLRGLTTKGENEATTEKSFRWN